MVAALAVRYPPLAVGDRSSVVMGWLGVLACLVLIPVLFGAFEAQTSGDASLTVPSPEAMYAGTAALVLTCLFAGLGIARRLVGESADRQRRLIVGTTLAMALTLATGSLLGGAILVNGLALEAAAPPSSIYGPVGTATTPPLCEGALTAGAYAVVDITASASRGPPAARDEHGQRRTRRHRRTLAGDRHPRRPDLVARLRRGGRHGLAGGQRLRHVARGRVAGRSDGPGADA